MTEKLLEQVRNRFFTYVQGGREDHSMVLSAEAEREADMLWRESTAEESSGNRYLVVLEALGWLHWARYNALRAGEDRNDLQASAVLFYTVYRMFPDRLPKELQQFLSSGDPGDIEDNSGTPSRSPLSYVARQYPSAYERVANLRVRLTHTPMASADKPDINGFCEGDRVQLVKPFVSESHQYAVGEKGTILITDTSPAQIEVGRSMNLLEVSLDVGGLIMTSGDTLERIPGRFDVVYSDDGKSVHVVPR
jgi:hypothetical protein